MGDVEERTIVTLCGARLIAGPATDGIALRFADASPGSRFLPSDLAEGRVESGSEAEFRMQAETRGREILRTLEARRAGIAAEEASLRRLAREVAAASDDAIRASLLDPFMRGTDPHRISRKEAAALVQRRIGECVSDGDEIARVLSGMAEVSFRPGPDDVAVVLETDHGWHLSAPDLDLAVLCAVGECRLRGLDDADETRAAIGILMGGEELSGSDGRFDEAFARAGLEVPAPALR